MKAFTYIEKGKFALIEKQKTELQASTDAIVRVICLWRTTKPPFTNRLL